MSNLGTQIASILNNSQEITFNIEIGCESLRQLISQYENNIVKTEFVQELQDCIDILLTTINTNSASRITQLVVRFLASLEKNSLEYFIQTKIISYLTQNLRASSDTVRQRICEFIDKFLTALNELSQNDSAQIDDYLFTNIKMNIAERLRDVNEMVQRAAIKAAVSLQELNNECAILNGYMFLLRKDPSAETRMLVVESMIICKATFKMLCNETLYDSDSDVRNRVLRIFEKKIPSKYFYPKLKKQIIDCLLNDQDNELLEQFLFKWLADSNRLKIFSFITSLELIENWFIDLEIIELNYQNDKLLSLMHSLYDMESSMLIKITEFNIVIAENKTGSLFTNLNVAFHFCSLVHHFKQMNEMDFLRKNLTTIRIDELEVDLIGELLDGSKDKSKTIILFQILNAFLDLNESISIDWNDLNIAIKYLNSIKLNDIQCICLLESILKRLNHHHISEFIMLCDEKIDRQNEEKFLAILCLLVARIDLDDYDELEIVDETNEMNAVEYLVTNILDKSLLSSNDNVRALTMRCLGLAACTSKHIAESYITFIHKMFLAESSKVVHEALKALFNIVFVYYFESSRFQSNIWAILMATLEKQLDCISDLEIEFIAFEGYAKLLLLPNSKLLPNRKRIVLKILNAFFNETNMEEQDDLITKNHKIKLKACLGSFLKEFTSKSIENKNLIAEVSVVLIDLTLSSNQCAKEIARTAYYFTYGTADQRQFIISGILDKINLKLRNQNVTEKWIEILVIFDLNQSDINLDNKSNSIALLKQILARLEKITEIIKAKKWKINQEKELKNLCDKIKSLLLRNDKKRPLNSVASISEQVLESTVNDGEQDVVVLSQSPNKKRKALKTVISSNQCTPAKGTKRKLNDITNKSLL